MSTKKLIVVLNTKGGVGKSLICSNLSQYYTATGREHLLLDCDESVKGLKRFHPEAEHIGEQLGVNGRRLFDEIFERTMRSNLVLVDMPGNKDVPAFVEWLGEPGVVDAFADVDVELTLVVPVIEETAVVQSLKELWERLGGPNSKVRWVVAKNYLRQGPLSIYENSKVCAALKTCGVEELVFDQIEDGTTSFLERQSPPLTLSAALKKRVFTVVRTVRLQNYVRRLHDRMAKISALN